MINEIINKLATTLEEIEEQLNAIQSIHDFEDAYACINKLNEQAKEYVAQLQAMESSNQPLIVSGCEPSRLLVWDGRGPLKPEDIREFE